MSTHAQNDRHPASSLGWRVLVQAVPVLALCTAGYMAHAPNRGLPLTPLWALLTVLVADALRRERFSSTLGASPAGVPVTRSLLLPQAAGLVLWGAGLGIGRLAYGATDVWLALTGALLTLCIWSATFIAARRGVLALAAWLGVALVATIGGSVVAQCVARGCAGLGTLDARFLGDLRIPVVGLGAAALVLTAMALRRGRARS